MITIDALTVRYGSLTVLDGLTMHLSERAVHGVVGVDGAGKSSLLRAVYGIITPDSGSVTRAGHPLRRRFRVHCHPSSDPAPYVRLFALPVDRPIAAWPAGMRKKLALTVALMQRKPLLLLDEPFDGLDAQSLYTVRQLIAQCRDEGSTVLVTSQRLATLEPLCDDIRLLDEGRVTAEYRRGEYARAAGELEKFFARHYLTCYHGKIN